MHMRLGFLSVAMLLTVCVDDVRSQAGPYIEMDLGTTVAPPITVQGSDNDWGTKCDLIINPLGLEAAGTTTIGDARLADVMVGYQLLAGVDYQFRQPVALGVKFRWVDLGEFASEPQPWNQLRSHESSVGRGETILYRMTVAARRFWGVSLSLKYRF